MEIKLNGEEGPTVRIGLIALVQVIVALSVFLAAMRLAQRELSVLEETQKRMAVRVEMTLESQRVMESQIKTLVEELRYYRERLDRHIEATGGINVRKDK